MKRTAKIYAHRGSRTRYPENTMGAYKLAVEEGADGIEIDIRTTKDGEIVISHDSSLLRNSGQDINIGEHTWEEISKISVHCEDRFGTTYKDKVFVPRLVDVLEYLKDKDVLLNIEVKQQADRPYGYIEQKTLAMVEEYGMKDRVLYSSFDQYILVKLKELDPTVRTGLLYMHYPIYNAGEQAKRLGCVALHPDKKVGIMYDDVDKAVALGLDCNVWTVNDPEEARSLIARGAASIITDMPAEMIAALEE